jgi:hypothetical protein
MSTLRHADLEIASFSVKHDALAYVEEPRRLARRRQLSSGRGGVVGQQGVLEWEWMD